MAARRRFASTRPKTEERAMNSLCPVRLSMVNPTRAGDGSVQTAPKSRGITHEFLGFTVPRRFWQPQRASTGAAAAAAPRAAFAAARACAAAGCATRTAA
jgi:hypothetical protein